MYDFVYKKMIIVLTLRHDFVTIITHNKSNLIEMSIVLYVSAVFINKYNELLTKLNILIETLFFNVNVRGDVIFLTNLCQ